MIGLWLLLAARVVPPIEPMAPYTPATPSVMVLDSGTPVWLLEDSTAPLSRIEISWGQGFRTQPDPEAAMVAGVLAQRRSEAEGESLLALGGHAQVGASAERVWANVEVLAGREEAALDWLGDVLNNPDFSRDAVRSLTRRWRQARRQAWRSIGRVHNLVLSELLFADGHPLAFRPSAADWRAVSRVRVVRAWTHMLSTGEVTVVAGGAVDGQRLAVPLTELLAPYQGRGRPDVVPTPDWSTLPRITVVDHPGAGRAWITHTRPAAALDASDAVLDEVVNHILGGTFASRLSMRLREQEGLVYDIDSQLLQRQGMGRVEITCSVHGPDAGLAMTAIAEVLSSMASAPPTEEELAVSVRALVLDEIRDGQHLQGQLRSPGVAIQHGRSPASINERLTAISTVPLTTVQQRAVSLFGEETGIWVVTGDAVMLSVALPENGWDVDRMRTMVR